ncbi:MAG: VOC family protein [Thermoplasmata archaeon]|nr:VOC family protein [Thermoplasmata archaeon]MCI4359276.1 VOC family protein [Thermoplasmata archaeon]
MFTGALVTLMVDDVARSVRFYRETLEFGPEGPSDGETAEFSGPGIRLRIHRRRKEIPTSGSGSSAVGLGVKNIESAAATLAARGVGVGRILRAGPRRIALFDDPDGNHWYLFDHRPG